MAAGRGTTIGNAILWLRGDNSPLKKTLAGSLTAVGATMTKMGAAVKRVGLVFAAIGGAAVAGVTVAVKRYMAFGDQIDKMSKRTGFAAKSLSELKYVMELSGSSVEGLEVAIRKMQRTIIDAGQEALTSAQSGKEATGEYTKTLALLGLKFQDLKDLSPEKQFELLTERIAGLKDATQRAALAQEIFGRSGTALLPMLASGADGIAKMRKEAHDLGLVIDDETAGRLATLKDNFQRVTDGISGMRNVLVTALLPTLEEFVANAIPRIKEGVQWVRDNQDSIRLKVEKFVEMLRAVALPAFKAVYDTVSGLIGKYVEWREAHPGLAAQIERVIAALIVLGPLLLPTGMVLSGIGSMITMIGASGAAVGALTLVGALALATTGILAVVHALTNLDQGGQNFLNTLITKIPGAQQAIDDFFSFWIEKARELAGWLEKIKYLGVGWYVQSKLARMIGGEDSVELGPKYDTGALQGAAAGGGGVTVNVGQMHVRNDDDIDRVARRLRDLTREELFIRGRR